MKLLVTGGHPSPALALIDYLREEYPAVEIHFIGREVAQRTTGQRASEEEAVTDRGLPFYPIETGKIGHGTVFDKIKAGGEFIRGIQQARKLVAQINPDLFISFGSYVAAPVAIACWLKKIPIVTHEQTRVAGISNRAIAKIADKVALSYLESMHYFPMKKCVVTGLPLRPQLFQGAVETPDWIERDGSLPLLYITGGSGGSHSLNHLIGDSLKRLVKDWQIIHVCGKATEHHDWVKLLGQTADQLEGSLRRRYVIREQLNVNELRWLYQQRTLICGRSGANTVAEITAFDLPALFIPLPNSHYDEQTANAQSRVKIGRAILLPQPTASPDTLLEALEQSKPLLAQPREPQAGVEAATAQLWQLALSVLAARSP